MLLTRVSAPRDKRHIPRRKHRSIQRHRPPVGVTLRLNSHHLCITLRFSSLKYYTYENFTELCGLSLRSVLLQVSRMNAQGGFYPRNGARRKHTRYRMKRRSRVARRVYCARCVGSRCVVVGMLSATGSRVAHCYSSGLAFAASLPFLRAAPVGSFVRSFDSVLKLYCHGPFVLAATRA